LKATARKSNVINHYSIFPPEDKASPKKKEKKEKRKNHSKVSRNQQVIY